MNEEDLWMILKHTGLEHVTCPLVHLDESAEQTGFVRWQWEYYRATYDYKIQHKTIDGDYYVRINTRAIEGKLEQPDAILQLEVVYLGKATFPHGIDYDDPIPPSVLETACIKVEQLKKLLTA